MRQFTLWWDLAPKKVIKADLHHAPRGRVQHSHLQCARHCRVCGLSSTCRTPPPRVRAGGSLSAPTQAETGDGEVSVPTHFPSVSSQAHMAAQSCSWLILPSLWSSGAAIWPPDRITLVVVSAHIPFSIPAHLPLLLLALDNTQEAGTAFATSKGFKISTI